MKILKNSSAQIWHFLDLKSNFKNKNLTFRNTEKNSQTPEKNYITQNTANNLTSFSLFLSYIYTSLGLEGSNLKILRLGRAHMPRNIQNYWFLTKKYHVKKSVPKIYNSPCALALKQVLGDVPCIWFLTKKQHVKKSVPQIYNSPRALALILMGQLQQQLEMRI